MFKTLFATVGISASKRFFFWLLDGAPDFSEKESVRLWCQKNHHWLALIAQKTSNTYDDQFVELMRIVFDSPELFDLLWNKLNN